VWILRGLKIEEPAHAIARAPFWASLKEGLRFVAGVRLLWVMAALVGTWQMCHHGAMVVQILYATRELGLNEKEVGLCYIGLGVGTVAAGAFGPKVARRIGVGSTLLLGFAICGFGWLQLALVPSKFWGTMAFVTMLLCFGMGAVLIFINFLALRQAVTPQPLLGRMTSTMRWLILIPAAPGAVLGGWLGEQYGLRWALAAGGIGSLSLAAIAYAVSSLPAIRELPVKPHEVEAQPA
jgi:MFS family permease